MIGCREKSTGERLLPEALGNRRQQIAYWSAVPERMIPLQRSYRRVFRAISLFILFWVLSQPVEAQESGRRQEVKGWSLSCRREADLKEEGSRVFEVSIEVEAKREKKENTLSRISAAELSLNAEKPEKEEKDGREKRGEQPLSVTVRETLDPRFSLLPSEERKLKSAGAQIGEKPDGSVSISWEAAFSGEEETPWSAVFSVQARKDFPGGNEVPLFSEESGVYQNGRPLWEFSECLLNVPLSLPLSPCSLTLFLGEKIPKTVKGKTLEDLMLSGSPVNWYGKGETGTLSVFWKKPDSTPVGTLSQLGEIRPVGDTQYAFSLSYTPYETGKKGLGTPVKETEASSLLRVNVVEGSLTVQAVSEGKGGAPPLFLLESDQLSLYRLGEYRKTTAGRTLYQADFSGLPFDKYRVTQLSPDYEEVSEEYWVGACPGNDTVDFQRASVKTWMELTPKKKGTGFETGMKREAFHLFPRDTLY